METYYVDGKNGNDNSGNGKSNNPWKTLGKAYNQMDAGDTVKIRSATYREDLALNKDNITFQADDGQQPVLDGGYNEGLFSGGNLPGPEGFKPGAAQANMISIRGNGVTVDGLTIQNIGGVGIGVSGSRATIRNCRIDFCYGGGLIINGGSNTISGPLVENNTITRCSVKYYHPGRGGAGPAGVQGTLNIIKSENAIVRHNIVAYSYGEGINIGKGSSNALVEGNVVHTCNHIHIYFNRTRDSIARNNFIYHLYLPEHLGSDRDAPTGIAIGDEQAGDEFPHSRGAIIYNNIVVGMGKLFMIRNGTNYDTQTDECYIGYNTFVARRLTRVGIDVAENRRGRQHRRTIFENNIIVGDGGVIGKGTGSLSGITFRNNLWSDPPPNDLRGQQDRIGDPRLANPDAAISGTSPGATNADPFNYRLTKNSTLSIGRASDGSNANNFRPPSIDRDFFNSGRDNAPDIGSHEYGGETVDLSANFSIGPGQGQGMVPHTVDFTDRTTSNATLVEWSWEFGDGSSSAERNPAHTYMNPGNYNVTLTVRDSEGRSDSIVEPDLVTALPDTPTVTPDDFRRFMIIEEATSNILAFGSQYPDQKCVLLWNSEPFHILNYNTIDDVADKYVDPGTVGLYWLDPVFELMVEENYPTE